MTTLSAPSIVALLLLASGSGLAAARTSLRFYGDGVSAPDLDRVKITLETNQPVNVGADSTVEFWMKASLAENAGTVSTGTDGVFTVSGTIGQPDAGQMSDGDFTVTGGFCAWPTVVQTPGAPTLVIAQRAPGQAVVSWAAAVRSDVLIRSTRW
ncbi:MAG: hypothetical protein IPM17_02525 [Verrucomicrobia bacterium]|nr:hypothetical protein [Verrucomicrobiota bacterium]